MLRRLAGPPKQWADLELQGVTMLDERYASS